jgi:hypothetical protein
VENFTLQIYAKGLSKIGQANASQGKRNCQVSPKEIQRQQRASVIGSCCLLLNPENIHIKTWRMHVSSMKDNSRNNNGLLF